MQQLPNNEVYGDYVCTKLIGGNAEGAVYKAHHKDDENSEYAVRVLQFPVEKLDKDTINECNDHMTIVKSVTAPHAVPVVAYGNSDHEYYIVMPYVEGKSLRHLIKRTDRQPESMPSFGEILTFTQTLVEALEAIHTTGLTHGAIEPRNILIDASQGIHLNDFGLSKLTKIVFSLANTGSFWTGKYTAPEVWDGERNTPSSDQYSLACVMYLLITGRAPFRAKTIFEMMEQHQNAIITPPHYIRRDAPSSLLMFFLTATAKRPAERFRSLSELQEEFALCIKGLETEPTHFFNYDVPEDVES